MLDVCAPGHDLIRGKHKWRVLHGGRTYRHLPTGQHGRKQQSGRGEVNVHFVKAMCRHLGIVDCARQQLSQLR